MSDPRFELGASIWGFYKGQPRETWPTLDASVASILSLDPSLGVELWASKALDAPAVESQELRALVEASGKAGFVTVHVRGVFWTWDPALLRKEVDFARAVGGRLVVLHPVCLGLKRPRDRMDVPEIRRLAEYAASQGVLLAIENVRDSQWVLDRILDVFGGDPKESNLGICLDVGHAHLSRDVEGDRVRAYLERYADALVHLHLHDNHGERDEHLAVGEGTIDWSSALQTLRRIGYRETAVLEVHGSGAPPLEALEQSLAVLCA